MTSEIPKLKAPASVQDIGEQSQACADLCNALRNLDLREGDEWDWDISKGNAVLTHPPSTPTSASIAAQIKPFTIRDDGTSTGHARIYASGLAGSLPSGFSTGDDPPYVIPVSDGQVIYAHLSYETDGYLVNSVNTRELLTGSTVPDDDPTSPDFYYLIGGVSVSSDGLVTGSNAAYGPIDATAYRLWFSTPAAFGIEWSAND